VTAFLTWLGIIGFTVGFALQDVMKNFAAGIILLIQKPFSVGEVIGVNGFDGTVLEITLRTTEMKALDGRLVTMPNADVLSNPIINYTRADRRRWTCPWAFRMTRIRNLSANWFWTRSRTCRGL
jgi:small conductance mechanosensitive channel